MAKPERILPQHVAQEAQRMYEERDGKGKRKYSMAKIGKLLGVGETTIFRAVNRLGPYVGDATATSNEVLDAEAAESFLRLTERLKKPEGA